MILFCKLQKSGSHHPDSRAENKIHNCANLHFVQYNETSDQYQLKQHVVTKDYDQIKTCMTRFKNFKYLKLLWFN